MCHVQQTMCFKIQQRTFFAIPENLALTLANKPVPSIHPTLLGTSSRHKVPALLGEVCDAPTLLTTRLASSRAMGKEH